MSTDGDLKINRSIAIPQAEFAWEYVRASGPGGQNVNKVNSKVRLSWTVVSTPHLPEDVRERFQSKYASRINNDGELIISSQKYRDQLRNKSDCLEKLQSLILAVLHPPKRRKPTRPTKGSKERRLTEKKQRSERKASRGKWSSE
ncbi:MAG: alternative ribosome rescue aminoacyl-tRNA hydrolase ArfB [Planctomycetota bacterium]|nr:alternative ribosome rescue aminoacyl-tRNA hydrolase ArfB [Planctomycetota bacterium]MDA1215028.1 alternative ribosome rescue aminoacyl-tRNA hydrolase ArfB [Planctomycetota bacterium]